MSSNEELWDQLAQRVARSQVGGVAAEDDDVLAAADLMEALINPHRNAQGGAGMGSAMPGMMPPMMMGGMGGAGMGGGRTGPAPEGAPGPIAAPNPGALAAGIPGEARMKPSPPPSGGEAGSVGPSFGGGGGSVGPGAGAGAGPGAGGRPVEVPGDAEPVVDDEPEPESVVGGVGPVFAESPADDVEVVDGFAVNPVLVRELGDRWAELGTSIGALPHHPESTMGLFERAQRPHQALSQQVNSWRDGAAAAFEAVAARLHATAAQYESADDEGVAAIRQTEGMTT